MKLPKLEDLEIEGKRVLLRMDLDVPVEGDKVLEDTRLRASISTIRFLVENGCDQIIALGHRGRPGGKEDPGLSLAPVAKHLQGILDAELGKQGMKHLRMEMAENMRFNGGEEECDKDLAEEWAEQGDIYINDAFASSAKESLSVTVLPSLLPSAAGLSLQDEVEKLEKVLDEPKDPVVVILGGGKADKAVFVPKFLEMADWVLVGGALAKFVESYCREDGGVCVSAAHLARDGKDITPDSARNFAEIIKSAGTIVWNGPMGDIDSGFWDGTRTVAEAIAGSKGYKLAGGGDTIHAISEFEIADSLDHVSLGGGAMLEFLAYKDLPGLRALRESRH